MGRLVRFKSFINPPVISEIAFPGAAPSSNAATSSIGLH